MEKQPAPKRIKEATLEQESLDKIKLANFRIAVLERAHYRCEVCGRIDTIDVHHIDGRKPPRKKTGDWPEEICEDWPHCPLNGIALCRGGHTWAGQATKHSKPLLWAWIERLYGTNIYKKKTIAEWLAGEGPWREVL